MCCLRYVQADFSLRHSEEQGTAPTLKIGDCHDVFIKIGFKLIIKQPHTLKKLLPKGYLHWLLSTFTLIILLA